MLAENGEKKLDNSLEVISEVSVTFSETEGLIQTKLEEKCSEEIILVERVFFCCRLAFLQIATCFYRMLFSCFNIEKHCYDIWFAAQ